MKKNILLTLFIIFSSEMILSDEENVEVDEYTIDNSDNQVENPIAKQPVVKIKKYEPPVHIKRTEKKMFINCRDNVISIIATDKDNKQYSLTLPAGSKKIIDHAPNHIKKVICCDKFQEKDIPLSQATLNANSVFIFNLGNTLEMCEFIDIQQKQRALNAAKHALRQAELAIKRDQQLIDSLTTRINDIEVMAIYQQ